MTYKPKQLSAEAFEELRTIAREEIEELMTDEQIEQMGIDLLNLFSVLATPMEGMIRNKLNDHEFKALMFLKTEIDQNRSPSVRQLSKAMGLRSSRSGHKLIDRGFLTRDTRGILHPAHAEGLRPIGPS